MTQLVPFTVAPSLGAVMKTPKVLLTVTVTLADVTVRPVASVTVTASVWEPLRMLLVVHEYEAVVVATVWVETSPPST